LLVLVLGAGPALSQQAAPLAAPGSLPPPRPWQPASPPAASPPPAPAPAAPRPPAAAQPPQAAPRATPQAPPQTLPARPPQTQPRPAQTQPAAQPRPPQARPPAQPRPAAQAPTVGAQSPPSNRRPPAGAAAAGAAAGAAAAAGGAAAATRTPEPAQPPPPGPPPLPPPSTGQISGLPIPRFASLRSDQVNMRVGPNTTFPIEWTFQRRDLPVMIVGEFQVWRRVRDADGAEGWVHQSTLAGRRTVLVRPPAATPEITLRRRAEDSAPAVARLRGGVIARIRECESGSAWCEVQVATHRGYLRRADVWGLLPDEEVN
jgi:SH3-like domain-containing protein